MNSPNTWNAEPENPNFSNNITAQKVGDVIWPTRTLQDIIGLAPLRNDEWRDFWDEVYVISKKECRSFEEKIGQDVLPETGKVILVKENLNSENVQIEVVSQDTADRVMETSRFHDFHHYFSVQHPQGFYNDREEM